MKLFSIIVGLGTYSREMARKVRETAKGLGLEALITNDYLEVESAMKEIQETVQKQTLESEKRINQIEKKSKEDVQKIATELCMDLIARFSDNTIKENNINKMVGDQIKGNSYD